MAAIDLELGLEHGGRGWGQERPEVLDSFDLEMQEWEDQLQDIQRKIEKLYNEVQTRRGANDSDNQKSGSIATHHDEGLLVTNRRGPNQPGDITVSRCRSNSCNSSCPMTQQKGHHPRSNGVSEISDLLQDYLGAGKQINRKNNGARHVRFSDTIKVSKDISDFETRKRLANHRHGQEQAAGNFEETEHRKNQVSHMRSSPCQESCPNKESACAKPPLGQRDAPARTQLPAPTSDSPSLERRSFAPGPLGDRKCSSPSVLRKFGAMLQENEGKTLTESGVVTHHGAAPDPKCPTSCCHRRDAGAAGVSGRAPVRLPSPKCQADSTAMTAERESCQESDLAITPGCQNYKDQRGGSNGLEGSELCSQLGQKRLQVPGSPKLRPRASSSVGGLSKPRKCVQYVDPKVDSRVLSCSPGPQKDCRRMRDEGLIELLDMLEIQHNYSSSPKAGYTCFRHEAQQDNPNGSLPVKPKKSFSRPARPANQRPPSRWASRTPQAQIPASSGPIYRPPSPLTRIPSPMARTPSPAQRHQLIISYSPQAETVIM